MSDQPHDPSNLRSTRAMLFRVGRGLGVLCGVMVWIVAIILLLTVAAQDTPSRTRERRVEPPPGQTAVYGGTRVGYGLLHDYRVRMIPTLLGGALAIAGSLLGRPSLLVLGFVIGFWAFYIGLYFLLVPGIASLIGYGEIGYLGAAFLISISRGRRDPS